jgi:two-component system response regulator
MSAVILLVEDNPSDEKLTMRAFGKWNPAAEIVVVRDGAEALDWLFATGGHSGRDSRLVPAVVFLDLRLPRVDGMEVLRRLRADERTRLVPVVILSASREDEDIERCYALGANAYVRKPVDYPEFAETAKALGHFWLNLNVAPRVRRSS